MLFVKGNEPRKCIRYIDVTETELRSIQMCDIQYDDINGWFDGESFDIAKQEWFDYSIHNNNINSSHIANRMKLGLFSKRDMNLYIYGSKFDSINMPLSLILHENAYSIITLARYNGNDRNTIFVSNDSNWVFGFKDAETDVIYHKRFNLTETSEPTQPNQSTQPTSVVSLDPTLQPIIKPTFEPTLQPTVTRVNQTSNHTLQPKLLNKSTTAQPTQPALLPTIIYTTPKPTLESTLEPTIEPTLESILEPTLEPTIMYTTPKPTLTYSNAVPLAFGFKWSESQYSSLSYAVNMTLYWSTLRYQCTVYPTNVNIAYSCDISDTMTTSQCDTTLEANPVPYGFEINSENTEITIEQLFVKYNYRDPGANYLFEYFCVDIGTGANTSAKCENPAYTAYDAISLYYTDLIFIFDPNVFSTAYVRMGEGTPQCPEMGRPYYEDLWIINVDSPKIFRSQQTTMYKHTITDNQNEGSVDSVDNLIDWGINILNTSDWAIATIILFSRQLSLSQIECMENFVMNKYNLSLNDANTNSTHATNDSIISIDDISYDNKKHSAKMYECDRWSQSFEEDIVSWYDVNNGFEGNTLFDLSGHSNDIAIDKNINVGIDEEQIFHYLYGSTYHNIKIPMHLDADPYMLAIYYVARYNGNDRGSIISDLPQMFSDYESKIYFEGDDKWMLSSLYIDNSHHNAWYCTQNCQTSFTDYGSISFDGSFYDSLLNINGEYNSEWGLTEIIIIQKEHNPFGFLYFRDSMCVEQYLSRKYHIDSYDYNQKSIVSLQFCNWFLLILIICVGVLVNYVLWLGFAAKIFGDAVSYIFQGCSFCFYCCQVGCCRCKCCCYDCCCACFLCMNCCCGSLKGICGRHCCAAQISIFPIYNVFSVLSSFTSIINRIFISKTELIPYVLLNGLCTLLGTIIHFIFTYQYLIGTLTDDDCAFFYLIQLEICMFLWSFQMMDSIRNCVNDSYWIITVSLYSQLTLILSVTINLNDEHSIKGSTTILEISQSVLMVMVTFIAYFYRVEINYCLYWSRSMMLILLIVVCIPGWNDVYKIWVFSILLVQYINLHVADFTFPHSLTLPKQYHHLDLKQRDNFYAMRTNATNTFATYQPFSWFSVDQIEDRFESEFPHFPEDIYHEITKEICDKCDDMCSDRCTVFCRFCRICCRIKDRVDSKDLLDVVGERIGLFSMDNEWNEINYGELLVSVHEHYQNNTLIVDPRTNNTNTTEHITLSHEYEHNSNFWFDPFLLDVIRRKATYHQHDSTYFLVEDIFALIIFLKFPTFRMLFNQNLLKTQPGFFHFYNKLCNVEHVCSIYEDLKEETRIGYTILNSQISCRAPIIFSVDIEKIVNFSRKTGNRYQGIVFRVAVSGIFTPLYMFGPEFDDIFIAITPTITTIKIEQESTDLKHAASELMTVLQFDKVIDDETLVQFQNDVIKIKPLITPPVFEYFLSLYHIIDETNISLFYDFLMNVDISVMSRILVNLPTININIFNNMTKLYCMVWLEFINNNDIENMSIIKLRCACHHCHDTEQKEKAENSQQNPGKLLLEYAVNGFLDQIPQNIKHIEWKQHIKNYILSNITPLDVKQTDIIVAERKTNEKEKVQKFMDIMNQYEKIMNAAESEDEEKQIVIVISSAPKPSFIANSLEQLFDIIDKEMDISQLMDMLFDIKNKQIADSDKLIQAYGCKLKHYCNILNNAVETLGTRSQSPGRKEKLSSMSSISGLQFDAVTNSKIELLDLIHIRLFHKGQKDQRLTPDIDDALTAQLKFEKIVLFKDTLYNRTLCEFCDEEQYDSEAIYDDMHPDNDAQSNIYHYFQNSVSIKNKITAITEYYKLKSSISKYTIYPSDNKAIKRNLIELDFGNHVIDWNVTAKFYSLKEEWLQNEFFPVDTDMYGAIHYASDILSKTRKNKNSFNLDIYDLLCIKMYTDTNDLQSNFRHAFRTSADANRRSQFIHWATNFQTVYIKIEMANRLYNSNAFISNVTLYHGLNRLFDTKQLVRQFYGILSTTWAESVARTFAGTSGMILQINQDINDKNMNALEVEWISCHHMEKEVLLMNPKVMIQKSMVFSKNIQHQSSSLKSIILSIDKDPDPFNNVSTYFQSNWIVSCLEDILRDKAFTNRVNLFSPQQCLQQMSLFEFIFFKCQHYQIATYIHKYHNANEAAIFEMIIGSQFFNFINDGKITWIESADRSEQLCSKYQPRMCKMEIVYEYNKDTKVIKKFTTKQGKPMLIDTNLILQYIDQRKFDNNVQHLTIYLNMEVKYQYMFHDGSKSNIRIWRYKLRDFKLKIKAFNWKITRSTTFERNYKVLYVSSLWISNKSTVSCTKYKYDAEHENNIIGQCTIVCKRNILIDENSAISMDECGLQGAVYNDEEKQIIYALDFEISLLNENEYSIGIGGDCVEEIGSNGGDGGGKIVILCENLIMKQGCKITCNGGNGIQFGDGGSGGSILVIANQVNIDNYQLENLLTVNGGLGDSDAKNGIAGSIKYGYLAYFDEDDENKHNFVPTNKNLQKCNIRYLEHFYEDDEHFYEDDFYNFVPYCQEYIDDIPLIGVTDIVTQSNYLKSKMFAAFINNKDPEDIFTNEGIKQMIKTNFHHIIQDKEFMKEIDLFSAQTSLGGMSVFEFIFFECRYYQIAYDIDINKYDIFEMLIGSDFFVKENQVQVWVQSVDRSQKIFTKYPPTTCEMRILYEYGANDVITKHFKTKEGIQMLTDTNLILQYIDQRKLYELNKRFSPQNKKWKGLVIHIWIEIGYDNTFKCNLKDFVFEIGTKFDWNINRNVSFTADTLYISSLCITNASHINSIQHQFRIVCEANLFIFGNSSICMDECGVKGAIYNREKGIFIYELDADDHGGIYASGFKFGGGAGYTEKGENGVSKMYFADGYGGNKYLSAQIMQSKKSKFERFSVGFGGGCGKNKQGSTGGNGGGKIFILCNNLRMAEGCKITSNGGDGAKYGGGGSGGSILIVTNHTNINETNRNETLIVNGGKGDKINDYGAGDGSDGFVQFGYIDRSTNDITFNDIFLEGNSYNYDCMHMFEFTQII